MIGRTPHDDNILDTNVVVRIKYFSDFSRFFVFAID